MKAAEILRHFKLDGNLAGGFNGEWLASGKPLKVVSPVDDKLLAEVPSVTASEYEQISSAACRAFSYWRTVPAPLRGEIVRQIGDELRLEKNYLGTLVSLEMGKPLQEGLGEVQEMIDICEYAVGLSRMFAGFSLPSERKGHRILEQWHPLGVVGVITAFNFPVAVWAWNASLALVTGNTVLWKPSSKTPLSALAVTGIVNNVLTRNGHPSAVCSLVVGRGSEIGDVINKDPGIPLVSYTGSVTGGRHVGTLVQQRFGKVILELGGNNAVIVSLHGDSSLALQATYFGAVGTAGQRCTSTRRAIIHDSMYERFMKGLENAFRNARIGEPFSDGIHLGPLVDTMAVTTMMQAMEKIRSQGGHILCGGEKLPDLGACYVRPCLVDAQPDMPMIQEETFAPILYCMKYRTLEEAIRIQNDVPQGLSSSIFTDSLEEAETFLGVMGSDCGLANINTGTSGAEIGGAFGGEKETGGGRESGSDAWKAYMRRQTSVINSSGKLALAQGIRFELDSDQPLNLVKIGI